MEQQGLWIFGALCFFSMLASGQAVTCFVCNSHYNESCLDLQRGTDNSTGFLRDCDLEPYPEHFNQTDKKITYTICRKNSFLLPKQDVRRVVRTCSWVKHKNDCYYTATRDLKSTVCQCTEPGCNDSSSLKSSGVAVAALLASLYLLCTQYR